MKDNFVLFAASFALLPLIVFNQQIITGRILQPVHYELYNANYVVLIALVLTAVLFWRDWLKRKIPSKALFWLAAIALAWGAVEVTGLIKRDAEYARIQDDAMPVRAHLKELAKTDDTFVQNGGAVNDKPVVLVANSDVADALSTAAPQPVLWSLHLPVFSTLDTAESKDRFYQYLYYTGTKPVDLARAIKLREHTVIGALFGYELALPAISVSVKPITKQEEIEELQRFSEFSASFSKEKASQLPLSYLLIPAKTEIDLTNLDRWYERDAGETIGKWKLHRLKLKF